MILTLRKEFIGSGKDPQTVRTLLMFLLLLLSDLQKFRKALCSVISVLKINSLLIPNSANEIEFLF